MGHFSLGRLTHGLKYGSDTTGFREHGKLTRVSTHVGLPSLPEVEGQVVHDVLGELQIKFSLST